MLILTIEIKKQCAGVSLLTDFIGESIKGYEINALSVNHVADGQTIQSWSISERLPYDVGYEAAMKGNLSESNLYALHFWKNNEWYLEWSAFN